MVAFGSLGRCLTATTLLFAASTTYALDGNTTRHEKGRCALKGQCGKQSLFGGDLPCADNSKADDPSDDLRDKLVALCGDDWSSGPVCCDDDQVKVLSENLAKAETFIASCPACKTNFYNLFCTFTCSPDQSTFVNVTDAAPKGDKFLVTELDQLWSDDYAETFYDSCKEVKFGATNTPAMNFIGGGAKNFTQFLAFLGQKSLLGSPFQINFPRLDSGKWKGMKPADATAHPCDSPDEKYRCSCVDCSGVCPDLGELESVEACHVGAWPCLSFSVVLVYALSIFLLVLALAGHVAYRKHAQRRNDRLRLLQDTAPSDDEDDEDQDLAYQFNHSSGPSRKYWLNTLCDRMFNKLGRTCARYPAITIGVSFVVVALLNLGWIRFAIEQDPVRLWVAPDSAAAQEKAFFDTHFGPFYRTEQAFLVNDTNPSGPGPVLSLETLRWWSDVENRVSRLKSLKEGVSLGDICFNPTGNGCVVQSVSAYWQGGSPPLSWEKHLETCVENNIDQSCLPDFGAPVDPKLVLGGVEKSPLDAKALVVTWVVNNGLEGSAEERRAMDWEEEMKNQMKMAQREATNRGLRLSFNTEISLEQELNKSTNTDAKIVVISYIVMFIYASIALGSTTLSLRQILRKPSVALVQSKFMLGIVGIVIVLFSVSASVGLFSAVGIKVTLIIAEVIPFLVLAVGVDNIFLIVHEFERVNASHPNETIEERMAKALGRMGPSILLSASMETIAFALGAFVGMPAVRNFAVYAAGAVVINALLQVTMFISTLALNQQRVEAGRADCVPCVTVTQAIALPLEDAAPEDSGLQHFIRRYYAPALLGRKTKVTIVTVFVGLFAAGLALLPTIQLGLDQRIAIPEDSYLIPYFNDLYDYFNSGPPVYFVTRDMNATAREQQQQLCGRFTSCDSYSLANVLEQESKRANQSFIATSTASWVDDFFLWLNPSLDKCCVDDKSGNACFAGRDPAWNITLNGMPEGEEYIAYLKQWVGSPTTEDCPLGGLASYSTAVQIPAARDPLTIPASHFRTFHTPLRSQADFINSYASAKRICEEMKSHNPGADVFPYSKHYIFFDQYSTIVRLSVGLLAGALAACFVVCSLLLGSVRTGAVVAGVVAMTLVDICGAMALSGVSLNAVTLVNLVICVGIAVEFCAHVARAFQFPAARLLADASVVAAAAAASGAPHAPSGLFSLLGPGAKPRMPRFGRQPSSYTNARLAAEAPAGARSSAAGRDARAWAALTHVGASVVSGITATKLLGVAVLAFTRSKIFEVYFFRVWLALVLIGAAHALVLLPVALSLLGGPEGWVAGGGRGAGLDGFDEGEDGDGVGLGVQEDLRRRMRGGGYADDDDDDDEQSDDGF